MPPAFSSQGTFLQMSDMAAVTPVFTTIFGCGDITGPGATRDTEDVTSHSSVGGYREYITTLRDGGEVTCDIFWVWDETQTELDVAFAENPARNWRILFPVDEDDIDDATGTTGYEFSGLITDLSWSSPVAGALKRSLTVKITGPVVGFSTSP
jgi:predicted secreted protein